MKDDLRIFKPEASNPIHGIAFMFDLAGFSKFFSQPDVHHYVPKYLNHVLKHIQDLINGETSEIVGVDKKLPPLPKPIHWKFLGDGVLILWKYNDFTKSKIKVLMNRSWNIMNSFDEVNKLATVDVPVMDIPNQIRFGISAGTLYKLIYEGTQKEEYIGYCINLASRLQSYCRELGFIVSARLNPQIDDLEKHGYLKVVAKKIKGFPNELVIVDKEQYDELDNEIKLELFAEID